MANLSSDIPLSLYIHIPWCVRKCPYCDFNSHEAKSVPQENYIDCLKQDLNNEATHLSNSIGNRKLQSIFIGGGTPSLFSGRSLAAIIQYAETLIGFAQNIEITMEVNPGTIEYRDFGEYRHAGINRLSFGVQSFNEAHLKVLGRIHSANEARQAYDKARAAGFNNINLDLMHGLPNQTHAQATSDLHSAIELEPEHISWYQLTIEPNTVFYSHPPQLPLDDTLADIQTCGEAMLAENHYHQYEISAFGRPLRQAKHNLNYWQFGDYLGIGAGAHGKITNDNSITRYWKRKQPADYLNKSKDFIADQIDVSADKLPLEFMMNALRLTEGVNQVLFQQRTGINFMQVNPLLNKLIEKGLIDSNLSHIKTTPLGRRFLNDVLQYF